MFKKLKNETEFYQQRETLEEDDSPNVHSRESFVEILKKKGRKAPKDVKAEESIHDGFTFYAHGKFHKFSSNSLGVFSNKSPLRKAAVRLATWKYFEWFITSQILANSLLLGMKDFRNPDSWRSRLVDDTENYFTTIFVLEAVTKILAMGFIIGKGSYLRVPWNWLDFIVVVTSLLTFLPSMKNFSGLRTFRLFRPLRNLTTFPQMRTLAGTLLLSMSQLGGILSLAIFFFLIFAIFGVSLWSGKIHYRCWYAPEGIGPQYDFSLNQTHPDIRLCSVGGSICPQDYECASELHHLIETGQALQPGYRHANVQELNWGITNFDNIGFAFLTIFQCITMEGWTEIMYIYMDAYQRFIVIFYCICCVVVCSLFLLNMTIAVMLNQYEELDKKESQRNIEELREHGLKAKLPLKLVDFLIKHEMQPKKPRKQEPEKQSNRWTKLAEFCSQRADIPEGEYYENKIVQSLFLFTAHPAFNGFITFIIVANTAMLACDKYPEYGSEVQKHLDIWNYLFTVIFALEVVFKVIGQGMRLFIKDKSNTFDAFIVVVSLIEISVSSNGGAFTALRAFRLFRIFKLFRIGDLRVLLDSIAFTITTIGNYVILLVLFIYVYALLGMQFFAGKLEFDANNMPRGHDLSQKEFFIPRANFDTLTWSSVTIFQVLIGDNWNTVMYDCFRTVGTESAFYFITLILFGNIIMLNLLLAILLGNFDRARIFQMKTKLMDNFSELMHKKKYSLEKSINLVLPELPRQMFNYLTGQRPARSQTLAATVATGAMSRVRLMAGVKKELAKSGEIGAPLAGLLKKKPGDDSSSNFSPTEKFGKTFGLAGNQMFRSGKMGEIQEEEKKESQEASEEDIEELEDIQNYPRSTSRLFEFFSYRSLLIFHVDNSVRQWCLSLVSPNTEAPQKVQELHHPLGSIAIERKTDSARKKESDNSGPRQDRLGSMNFLTPNSALANSGKQAKLFDSAILVLIVLSSLTLALDNPLDNPDSNYKKLLFYIDCIFTFAFLFECIIKTIALGFFTNNLGDQFPAYIRSSWNLLDFIVVIASLTDFFIFLTGRQTGRALKSLKALRALRALRPLRVISRNEGLRLVVNALLASIPAMTNVIMVCLLFLMIFAIMGINFFKGSFFHCEFQAEETAFSLAHSLSQPAIVKGVKTEADCLMMGGEWVNRRSNFDNIFQAMICLFEMMTTEGWMKVMYQGIDSKGPGLQPERNHREYTIIFFVSFMIIGSQFILNLFVGVVIDNFNKIKEKELGNFFLTERQKLWLDIQKLFINQQLKVKLIPPENKVRLTCYQIVTHSFFEYFITTSIVCNTITMALRYYTMTEKYAMSLSLANYVFSAIFNLEAILKLLAMGKKYFLEQWNLFDFVVVIGTNFGVIINLFYSGTGISSAASVVRGFRIMRIFKLSNQAKNIKVILDTVVNLLPQITNIMSLIFLLFFIYAALGINLFSGVMYQDVLNEKNNFRSFGNALLVLMRCATGEDWNLIMAELAVTKEEEPDCKLEQSYEEMTRDGIKGCGTNISYIFFISFMVVISMLFMNLSVAAVIEGLNAAKEQNSGIVTKEDAIVFLELWKTYDPKALGWIEQNDLVFFLYELPAPFTIKDHTKEIYFDKAWLANRDKEFREKPRQKKTLEEMRDRFIINEDRNLYLLKNDALKILAVVEGLGQQEGNFKENNGIVGLPLYDNGCVHFKDVLKYVVRHLLAKRELAQGETLETVDEYKLVDKIRERVKRDWYSKFKQLRRRKKIKNMTSSKKLAMEIIKQYVHENTDRIKSNIKEQVKKRSQGYMKQQHQGGPTLTTKMGKGLRQLKALQSVEGRKLRRGHRDLKKDYKWLHDADKFLEEMNLEPSRDTNQTTERDEREESLLIKAAVTPEKPFFLVPNSNHSVSSKNRLALPKKQVNYHKQVSADLHFSKKKEDRSQLIVQNGGKEMPSKTPRKNFTPLSFFKNMFASGKSNKQSEDMSSYQ